MRFLEKLGVFVMVIDSVEKIDEFIEELRIRMNIKAANYMLGKPKENKEFNAFEKSILNIVDLGNPKVVNVAKIIWEHRDDDAFLNEAERILSEESR